MSRRFLLFLILLLLGNFAGTQEPDLSGAPGGGEPGLEELGFEEPETMGVPAPDFAAPPQEESPSGPPRWFRSNAAGMALEEIPSRIAALRNEYALGLDYIPSGELPAILIPYYEAPWQVEIRILYKNGDESRRQWIFRDPEGMSRLIAVFDQDLLNPPE
ncbi:MAG: hypothetical protein LBL28_06440, partial [Treponema sp.]|nr:hypothetical protein [Treponema sp.]